MWTALSTRIVAILAGIATVVAAATKWGVWPMGVLVLLGVALLAALSLLYQERRRAIEQVPDDEARLARRRQQEHDFHVVREIRELVPRESVNWLRDWDFGASWQDEDRDPFVALVGLDDVEHRPLNDDLGDAVRALFDANRAFTAALVQHSFRERNENYERWRNLGWSAGEAEGLEGEQRQLWEERRATLNAAADGVADAYDHLIEIARRNLVL